MKDSQFWDRHAKGYAKRPVKDQEAYQKKLNLTQERLTPDMRVLEFGCGSGTTALSHAPLVKHIHAIDISGKMIDIAQAKAEAANINNVTFEKKSIDELDAHTEPFDVVMGHSILHLMENWQDVIEKAHSLLKPGGLFVTNTACLHGKIPLLKAILPLGKFLGLLPSLVFLSTEELVGHMKDTGFCVDTQWQPDDNVVFIIATKT